MELVITDKHKKELFIAMFQNLKNCSTIVTIVFKHDCFYIQGMDKSHVCMYDIVLKNTWFDKYNLSEELTINIDTSTIYTITYLANDNYNINFSFDHDNPDELTIKIFEDITKKQSNNSFNKEFVIPLIEFDYEFLQVPQEEYEAEFILNSKKTADVISQLSIFGDNITLCCDENEILFTTTGTLGKMSVSIDANDIEEYAVIENEMVSGSFLLNNIYRMCINHKIAPNIGFYLSNGKPIKINYNINEESHISFYIAPKID